MKPPFSNFSGIVWTGPGKCNWFLLRGREEGTSPIVCSHRPYRTHVAAHEVDVQGHDLKVKVILKFLTI